VAASGERRILYNRSVMNVDVHNVTMSTTDRRCKQYAHELQRSGGIEARPTAEEERYSPRAAYGSASVADGT